MAIAEISAEYESAGKGTKEITPKPRSKRRDIEEYLSFRFRFRYNIITGQVEFTGKKRDDFRPLDDYTLNSIVRDMDNESGLTVSPDKLKILLKSNFIDRFNPIEHYFRNRPKVSGDQTDTITALAMTVSTEKPELFDLSLRKWLVATIANALTPEGCQNQTCLVLTGGQGAFKTTWLNLLIPPALKSRYLFCGKINLESKDTLILLGEKLIINLDDQLRSLNKRDGETVKTLITQGTVTIRRPYDALSTELPRIASFVGSINGSDFLTDPTGSRRFLPFEVQAIDIEKAKGIDIDQVWTEAYNLYKNNYQYWFTAEETAQLFGNNEAFQVHTHEYELLLEYYEPVASKDWANRFLTTTQIQIYLKDKSRQEIRQKQLGEALRKLGFIRVSKSLSGQKIYTYAVRERSEEEREEKTRYE